MRRIIFCAVCIIVTVLACIPVQAAVLRSSFDELRIQEKSGSSRQDTRQEKDTAVYSTDELHVGADSINEISKPNDGYRSGYWDELHVNAEAAKQHPVYFPERKGFRISGFDELHYPEEM